jgi:hypothetical protein
VDPAFARGRRGNGLQATDWGALVDLDPRLSEALLARLGAAGVAAYVEPALSSETFTRAATLPDRPLDRLWVDAGAADAARQVVGAEVADLSSLLAEDEPGASVHGLVQPVPRTAARRVLAPPPLPGRPAGDADEEFRRIVEQFGREDDSPVAPWPVSEDVDPPAARRPPGGPRDGQDEPAQRPRTGRGPQEDLPAWLEPAPVEDEGHYEPPPAPPLPRVAPRTVAATVALLAGVVLMFAPGLLLQDRTPGVGLLGVLLTVGGAAALLLRLRDAPPEDSGPDDGAVV